MKERTTNARVITRTGVPGRLSHTRCREAGRARAASGAPNAGCNLATVLVELRTRNRVVDVAEALKVGLVHEDVVLVRVERGAVIVRDIEDADLLATQAGLLSTWTCTRSVCVARGAPATWRRR